MDASDEFLKVNQVRHGNLQIKHTIMSATPSSGQYLNDETEWAEESHEQPPPTHEEPQQGYGGIPTELSLLSIYHKHRKILISNAEDEEIVKKTLKCVTNGKMVINLPKPNCEVHGFGNCNWAAATCQNKLQCNRL
ncbi:hypothetical protein P8452_08378 [Trifolium repens]|nr:hypothetical protein P8452_08378 [Trifolium repens]